MPVDCGSITPSRAHAATAASAAVPPARITSIAVSAASGCDVATIAFWAWTVDRLGKWKFLIPGCSLYRVIAVLPHFPQAVSGAGLHDTFMYRGAMVGGRIAQINESKLISFLGKEGTITTDLCMK